MIERRFLSLIELLIVISLIVVVAATVTWNLVGLKEEQQFHTSSAQMEELLQTAQELMLIYNEEVTVILTPSEKGLTGQIKTRSPLYTKLGQQLKEPLFLAGIQSYSFGGKSQEPITLIFSPALKETPEGILSLSAYPSIDTEGPLKARFYFSGFPHVIQANRPLEKSEEESFPEEIRAEWDKRDEKNK